VLGWLLALWTSQVLAAWMGLGLDLAPDSTVLGFTLLVSLLTGLLFGLAQGVSGQLRAGTRREGALTASRAASPSPPAGLLLLAPPCQLIQSP